MTAKKKVNDPRLAHLKLHEEISIEDILDKDVCEDDWYDWVIKTFHEYGYTGGIPEVKVKQAIAELPKKKQGEAIDWLDEHWHAQITTPLDIIVDGDYESGPEHSILFETSGGESIEVGMIDPYTGTLVLKLLPEITKKQLQDLGVKTRRDYIQVEYEKPEEHDEY